MSAKLERDNYYKYLKNKYRIADIDDLVDAITENENKIRERLELKAMREG